MAIFEKYNFSDDHAKWLVTKAFPRTTSAPTENNKKAGTVYNSLSYNPSDHIKSVSTTEQSAPKSNSKKRTDLIVAEYYFSIRSLFFNHFILNPAHNLK